MPAAQLTDPAAPAIARVAGGVRERPRTAARISKPRLGGLDGLRAIAVTAVVVFHLRSSAAKGGFLGVDLFFVISGFLITYLVIDELLTTRSFALADFFRRRIRRLMPTVVALLVAITAGSLTLFRDELAYLRGGVLSSLTYVTNWWLIFDHQSYFQASGRPSFFQHMWSLAIEEQFYIVWAVLVLLVAGRRWVSLQVARRRALLVALLAVVLAVASTVLMTVVAVHEDLPYGADTGRVYFGSDTHSMGLFLGSAAGAYLAVRCSTRPRLGTPRRVLTLDIAGAAALLTLVVWFLTLDEYSPGLYRGGFLGFGAVALVVVVAAVQRGSRLGAWLDTPVLRWVGQRSYAIYVWHWPVVVVTRPGLDIAGPSWFVQVLRILLILALAELTYVYVEQPFRRGGWRALQEVARRRPRPGPYALRGTLLVAGALVLLSRPVQDLAFGTTDPLARQPAFPGATAPAQPTPSPTPSATAPAPTVSEGHTAGPRPTIAPPKAAPKPSTKPTPKPTPQVQPGFDVSAFGDSVLLGASGALRGQVRSVTVDSVEGRQAYSTLGDVQARAAAGTLAPYVVVHTGNNGVISPDQLRATLKALGSRTRVVLLTDRVPRDWQDGNNSTIRAIGGEFRNVTVLDWNAVSAGHSEWFYRDGLHLTPTGAGYYAAAIVQAFGPLPRS